MAKSVIPKEFDPDGFARFWAAYPRREAKVDAYKAWRQKQPSPHTQELIHAALTWQIVERDWRTTPQYCPLPAGYLRQERWTDERRSQRRVVDRGTPDRRVSPVSHVGRREVVPLNEPL